MHLRCERCSTVYELDERILPPGGAPVQCSRCRHVFHARPSQDPAKTRSAFPPLPESPGQAAGESAGRPGPGAAARARSGAVSPAAAPAPTGPAPAPSRPGSAPAAARVATGAAPVPAAHPSAPHQPPLAAQERPVEAVANRADTATMLVRWIRGRPMWRWLGPLLLVVAGGVAGGVLWRASGQISSEALAARQQGLRLLAADDTHSLRRAAELLAEAARLDPRLFQARADRALALTLLAADERDRAAGLEAGLRALDAERLRLEAEEGEGWQGRQAEVIDRMRTLERQIEPLRERAAALGGEAVGEFHALDGPHGDDPAVARALAMQYILDGKVEQASRLVRNARAARLADPWLDLAEAAADVVAASSDVVRQRAVARLAPLAAAHPDLLRARMLLARAEADLGRLDAAVAALDVVLEANEAHEKAREMKARLLQPPSVEPLRPRVSQQAPPPGRPGRLPRKEEGAGR